MSGGGRPFERFRHWMNRRGWSAPAGRIQAISKRSAYVLGGQLLGLFLGFGATFILSHLVAKRDYANFALFISIASVGVITHGGLINFASRFWTQNVETRPALWRFVERAFWRAAPFLAIFAFLSIFLLEGKRGGWTWWLLFPLSMVSTVGLVRFSLQTTVLNSAENYRALFQLNALGSILKFVGPIGLAYLGGGSFSSLAWGFALYAAGILIACQWLFRPTHATITTEGSVTEWQRALRSYGQPFIWIGIGSWILQFADRWIVVFFFDAAKVADFSYASQIVGFLPSMLAMLLLQISYPGFFRHVDHHKDESDWRMLSRRADLLLVAFLSLTILGTAAAFYLFQFLLGTLISETYRNSLYLIVPAAMVATALQANQFHYMLLQASLNSRAIMRTILWVAVAKTSLSVIAAMVSWSALQISWIAAPVVAGVLGRSLVKRTVFGGISPSRAA